MRVSTWIPKHSPLPMTLADVESSREKPVLCWWLHDSLRPTYRDGLDTYCQCRDGKWMGYSGCDPKNLPLYSAPSRPTKLEDVPDRRIVQASWTFNGKPESFLMFKVKGQWLDLKGESGFKSYNNPAEWQLTDHVAELVETEIGVVE